MASTKAEYNLVTVPNILLREPSQKVGVINQHIKEVVRAMEQCTLDWEDSRDHEVGVALAAVQIGQPLKIVVIRNDFDNKEDRTFNIFINPEITKFEGDIIEDFEGCLSVQDIYGKVPRYTKVRVKAKDINGREFRATAEGFLARIFQHEIDHTAGRLFIDHIREMPEAFYRLMPEGNLEKIDYDKEINKNSILW